MVVYKIEKSNDLMMLQKYWNLQLKNVKSPASRLNFLISINLQFNTWVLYIVDTGMQCTNIWPCILRIWLNNAGSV